MSNYTPIVLYGPKDSLAHLDPNKAIKGVQMDAELSAIATAISTKVDTPLQNLSITGTAFQYGATIQGSATSGQSLGLWVKAGTTSGDGGFVVTGPGGGTPTFQVRGDGRLLAGSLDFTPTNSSFVVTASGALTGAVTLNYVKIGPLMFLYSPVSVTSGGSGLITFTALPVGFRPSVTIAGAQATVYAGGTIPSPTEGYYTITTAGVISLFPLGGAFSANAGINAGLVLTYVIQ